MRFFLINIRFVTFSFFFLVSNYLNAGSIKFSSPYSNIILSEGTHLAIASDNVEGWVQRSIIRESNFVSNIKLVNGFVDNDLTYENVAPDLIYNNSNAIIASDGTLSLKPLTKFYSNNYNNKIDTFKWYKNGFILQDDSTSCTFKSVFSVGNIIKLNGGNLFLNTDLKFLDDLVISTSGFVNFYNQNLSLGFSDLNWTSSIYWSGSVGKLNLNSKVSLSSTWTFSGNCIINGNRNVLDLNSLGQIIVERGSTLKLKNLVLFGINDKNLQCMDDAGKIILDNILWVQDSDYSFSIGQLEILNFVELSDTNTFFYESSNRIKINKNSTLNITGKKTFAARVNKISDKIVFNAIDDTSILRFDNSKLLLGREGLQLLGGQFSISGRVDLTMTSSGVNKGFFLGNGEENGDLLFLFESEADLHLNNGFIINNLTKPNYFVSRYNNSKITKSSKSNTYYKRDIIISNMTIEVELGAIVLKDPNVLVELSDVTMKNYAAIFDVTATLYNAYTLLLDGNKSIFIKEGVLPFNLFIMGFNNYLRGNGKVGGQFIFADSNSELSMDFDGKIINNITLVGNKLNLLNNLSLSRGISFLGDGEINLSNNNLVFGTKDLTWTSSIYWDSDGGILEFNSMIELSSTWTFSGNCVLNGNNNLLVLNPTGQIVIERGSSLELNNLRIKSLEGTNIKCLDDTGQILLSNCKAKLSNDYNFEKGALYIDYKFDVQGSYTFNYKSRQKCYIGPCSVFRFFPKTTFSYAPAINAKDLIEFDCNQAVLYLDNASLHTTATGLSLTKGNLEIKEIAYFNSDIIYGEDGRVVVNEGITLGNNIEKDDFTLKIFSGGKLNLVHGSLIYKNISNLSNVLFQNSYIFLNNETKLKLYQDFYLGEGLLICSQDSIISRLIQKNKKLSAKKIKGNVSFKGNVKWEDFY